MMLNRISSLFQKPDPALQLEHDLAELEAQVAGAARDYQATILARAADRCLSHGDEQRALVYFGRAIDAYLEFGYFDVAAALCRRVIELFPQVVRTRCTLAFLSLGRGLPHLPFTDLLQDARREIGDYVHAARRAGLEDLAAERLFLMSDATDSPEISELIGECLLELGSSERADYVFGMVNAKRNDVALPPVEDQRIRWARALRVSIVSSTPAAIPEAQA